MANATNNHTGPLGLPNGQVIPAGATIKVDDWSSLQGHPVVAAWVKAGALSAEKSAAKETSGTYSVKEAGSGWFVVVGKDGKEVTKKLRKDDVAGFAEKSDADKTAFVEANKAEA